MGSNLLPILRDASLRLAPQDEGQFSFIGVAGKCKNHPHPEEGALAPVAKDWPQVRSFNNG
jgi:hypothetical protein